MDKQGAIILLDEWYQKRSEGEFWGLGIISIALLDFINKLYADGFEIVDRKIHEEIKNERDII